MSKMKISDRAKIFAPYDALKGFKEMLKEQELPKEDKKSLSEEQLLELNNILLTLEKGMIISVKHYNHIKSKYEITEGVFIKFDQVYKCIYVVKTKISFDNILNIRILSKTLF